MTSNPHFVALLTYISEQKGGMTTPASSGYRPAIKFPFEQDSFTGIQDFIGTDLVFAGDVVSAEITLLSTEYFIEKIYEGLDFEFYERNILIGTGVITKILNSERNNSED